MTDLIRNYCYPLEQQKAAGHPSSNFSLFLKTGKLSHLCASSYTSVLPAAAPKSSKGSEKQKNGNTISSLTIETDTYKVLVTSQSPTKNSILSTYFIQKKKLSGGIEEERLPDGLTVTLYKTSTPNVFYVDDTAFEISEISINNILCGTVIKCSKFIYVTILCEITKADDQLSNNYRIIHVQINEKNEVPRTKMEKDSKVYSYNDIVDIALWQGKDLPVWIVMTKKNYFVSDLDFINVPDPLNYDGSNKTEPLIFLQNMEIFTCCGRGRVGDDAPFLLMGTNQGNIFKIHRPISYGTVHFNPVALKKEEKDDSTEIHHICCGHLKNTTYKEFYYATEKYLYFDSYNEPKRGTTEWTIRKVPIPENWKIQQLICTKNEERIIALLSFTKKDENSQVEIMIIPNLKPGQSSNIRFENRKINQRRYYFGNSYKNVIITVLDNQKLRLIDGNTENDFSLILENMEENNWLLKKELIPKIGDTQTNDTKERQKRRADTQPKNTLKQQMSYYSTRRAARNYDAPERTFEEIRDILNTIQSAEHHVTAFLELSRVCMNTQRTRIDDSLKWFYYIRNFKWPDELLQKTYTEHYITFFINWFNNLKDSDNVKFTENSFVDDIAIFEIGPTPKIEPANPELAKVFQEITSLFIKHPRRRIPKLMKIFYTAIEDDNEDYNEDLIRGNFNTIDESTVKKLQNLFSKEKLKTEEILFNERRQGIYDKINRLYDRRLADEAKDIIVKLRDTKNEEVLWTDITQKSADQLEEFLKDKRGQTDKEWAKQKKHYKENPSPVEIQSDDE